MELITQGYGEGVGGWSVVMILAGDMDNIWRLWLPGWDGRFTSGVVMVLLGLAGNDIQNLYFLLTMTSKNELFIMNTLFLLPMR